MKIIYIHGFLSSSNAQKAQILRRELKKIKEIDFQSVDYPDDLEYSVDYLCKTIESEIEKGTLVTIKIPAEFNSDGGKNV